MTRILTRLVHAAGRVSPAAALVLLLVTAPASAQVPASEQPRTGGTVRIGSQDPLSLNPYFSNNPISKQLDDLNLEGLARGAPDGSFVPVLATEIPTQTNGDVSADGTVVTWRLRPGVTWSDGQPFTSQDVVFTYRMLMDPANPVVVRGDYAVMDAVAAFDDNTVVVTYKQLFAPYRLAFPYIFPAHVFNGQTSIAQDPFNEAPSVGTGPFVLKSRVSGDSMTYDRNPNYREPGKPYLDEVVVKYVASRDANSQALAAGDVDAALNLDASNLPQLATLPDVSVDPAPAGGEYLYVNTSCSSGPQQGDPSCQNPVLGDVRVRQAIELAIDKQALVRALLADRVKPAVSVLPPTGPYAVDLPPSEFNPEKARQLLDQAGWMIGSDGIRSQGAVRADLTLFTSATATLWEQTAQVIQGNLQDVGIETEIREVPGVVLAGSFATNSPLSLGNFDLAVFGGTGSMDPEAGLYNHYASNQVPNPQLKTGSNYDRIQDPKLDQALAAASNVLDDTQRQAAYETFSELIRADEAVIPLYPNLQVDARKSYVQGWGPTNVNDYVTWNIQDWWLNQ